MALLVDPPHHTVACEGHHHQLGSLHIYPLLATRSSGGDPITDEHLPTAGDCPDGLVAACNMGEASWMAHLLPDPSLGRALGDSFPKQDLSVYLDSPDTFLVGSNVFDLVCNGGPFGHVSPGTASGVHSNTESYICILMVEAPHNLPGGGGRNLLHGSLDHLPVSSLAFSRGTEDHAPDVNNPQELLREAHGPKVGTARKVGDGHPDVSPCYCLLL